MQQRRLRLGDVLDDYCPRERRITNHVVVAMIDDTVKQTRCSTCDADHEYKQAKVPAARRRKVAVPAAQLVEGASQLPEVPETVEMPEEAVTTEDNAVIADGGEPMEQSELAATAEPASAGSEDGLQEEDERDEWPVHRPLIRAQLPRPEGHTPERKAPDFTFRQSGGKFDQHRNGQRPRGHRQGRQAHGGGQSQPGQGSRFGGQRGPGGHGGPQGQRHGNRPGQGGGGNRAPQGQGRGPRPGGGRKRGR